VLHVKLLLGAIARLINRPRPIAVPREIGDLVLGLRRAPVVVVPARKGGVGKTVTAGAIAQVIGYAIGETTGTAAIVDQNIGNPDQWGRLDIPSSAATVRQLMAALSSGMELPPTPAWAKTPALAVYPEDRASAEGYPPGLIQRFVQYMRERHVFLVVDLPNRLPDYSSAEAAICAAYLDVADLVILPTTDDPTALMAVLEYLDMPSLRGKPVVVSHIVSGDKELRQHPLVAELLEQISRRVTAIVAVPKSEKATLAIVKGVSVLEISPQLRSAYIDLTYAAVKALVS
jgi:cellulose biosynthesis protein BcsQ